MVFRAVRFSVWKNLSIVCTVRGVHRELCLLQRNFAATAFSPPTSLVIWKNSICSPWSPLLRRISMVLLMLLVSCYDDPTSIPPAIGQTPCDLDWVRTKQVTTGWTVQGAAHQSKFIPWALQDSVIVLRPTKYRSVFRFSLVAAFPPFLFQNKKLRFPFFQTRHLKNWAGVSQTKRGYMRTSSPFSVQGKWPELCCKRMFWRT